ncbi:MAG: phosphatase PAP2 family protein [Chloroflexi bacterium]|nr:phosphatase PAP2 family protein [Chloroflexota bacterium]
MAIPPEDDRERVRQIVEEAVAEVDSPATADAVVERLEQLAADVTEATAGEQAAQAPEPAVTAIEEAATDTPSPARTAEVLTTAAAQAVAPTPEASEVLAGARAVLAPQRQPTPAARRGRDLLRAAILRRMGPLQRLDTCLYLAANGVPHPPWLDRAAAQVTRYTTGGWIWALGVLVAGGLGAPRAGEALRLLVPCMAGATWFVEHPAKTLFRRRRPFIDIVRALVVGKRPGSWSFPSGHTASSFAAAWTLSTVWPWRAPVFFLLAWGVGASRVYVGAHYPGDVLAGATFGALAAEAIRRGLCRTLFRRHSRVARGWRSHR